MTERRSNPRVALVLDATWHGLSGASSCRVTDISLGGCFIQSLSAPAIDDDASIRVTVGDAPVGVRGRVRYIEPNMGFAIKFDGLSDAQARAIRAALDGQPVCA
jgi:hypothetical protein